jgi:hypothetical protein
MVLIDFGMIIDIVIRISFMMVSYCGIVTGMDLSLVLLTKIVNPLLFAMFNYTTVKPMLIVEITFGT